jgi:hypothetical protein
VEEPAKVCPRLSYLDRGYDPGAYSVGRGLTDGIAAMAPLRPHRLFQRSTATHYDSSSYNPSVTTVLERDFAFHSDSRASTFLAIL